MRLRKHLRGLSRVSQIGYDRDSWATFFYFKFNAKLVDVLCFELGVEIEHELSSQILTSKKPTEKSIKEFTLDMIKTLGELMNQLLQVSHYSYTAQSIVEVLVLLGMLSTLRLG